MAAIPRLRDRRPVGCSVADAKSGAHTYKTTYAPPAELERSEPNSFIAMYTAYFDDSGTDGNSEIAVAACYISTKQGWDRFVDSWDYVRAEEEFDTFHMADFNAPPGQAHEPFCGWNDTKKERVYRRLTEIINDNKWIGIARAVHKETWDHTPERVRQHFGRRHYTFAVRACMMSIAKWKSDSLISLPIRYIFDWEMKGSQKQKEISAVFDIITSPMNENLSQWYGVEPSGFSFEHKEKFKPLQAADILAWHMRSHMGKIWQLGHDEESLCAPTFRMIRQDQDMDLGFMTEEQINKFVKRVEQFEKEMGPLPPLYP